MLTTFSFAALDWYAVFHNEVPLKYITKPLVMVWLIAWLGVISGLKGPLIWFGAAAILSLAGDVLLMLPRNMFMGGLLAFLAAHIFYIIGLNLGPLTLSPVLIGVTLIMVALILLRFKAIKDGVWKTTGARRLRGSVLIYMLCVSGMLLSSFSTLFRPDWLVWNAAITFLGGALFFTSDAMLAFDRFVNPMKDGRLLVRITYHTGQIFLLGGVFLHYIYFIR
jgi:uncharacterized membrane protein YhhN